ncbi:MAG: ABC transporter permease [Acidimicrobiales bacterium]
MSAQPANFGAVTGVGAAPVPRLRLPRIGWAGMILVGAVAAIAAAAPRLAPYRVTELAGSPLEGPSTAHLLGTNSVGQDVLSQLIAGARISLFVAVVAGGGTLVLGAAVGILAGWLGGHVDALLMRVVDVVLVIPKLPLLILAGAYVGPSLGGIAAIIALTSWPPSARVLRAQVLSLRRRAHLRAALGFGAGALRVLRRHIVPELGLILASGLVAAAGRAVALEAGLAFLGLGDPSGASWGSIMRDALDFSGLFYTRAWSWWLVPPVMAIAALLMGITFLGIAVEQRVNPALARHATARSRR